MSCQVTLFRRFVRYYKPYMGLFVLDMVCALVVSAVGNFLLSLCFLLPVLNAPATQQALEYNYAVGRMTWWGYLVIGVPLLITLVGVLRHLIARLGAITGLDRDHLMMR